LTLCQKRKIYDAYKAKIQVEGRPHDNITTQMQQCCKNIQIVACFISIDIFFGIFHCINPAY
jgi:hypothetical protein